ncbi:alpha/beta fold hydrolase [Caulobacter sp. FWC2]|uniref:alpha/beta fold hydrolase n=1 Tax=Caulobacter sp. FWC2 TaxID=69664 RepID=UPI000C157E2F|nr:alpha/beta hydrolase [Caulobacter sp. FWC2]PIB90515.1 alpha/beta hydrolase [Caulobacter sp. FWC2]
MLKTLLLILGGLLAVIVLAGFVGWLLLRGPDIPYEKLEAEYASKASHYADLPGGVRLHYKDEGKADGKLLVLVHGFGDSHFSWEGWVARLSDRYRIITVDLPGHGLTRAPVGYVASADGFADLIEALAAKENLPKFAIAGNSMGGGVAWQVAVRHPERLNGLVLVDAAGWPAQTLKKPPLAFKLLKYSWGRAFLRSIDNKPLIRSGLRGEVGDPAVITDAFIDRWAELQRAPGHRAILMSIQPGKHSQATREVLSTIKVPTLVLWGEIDPLIEVASAHKFAEAIPGAKLIVYPKVGHLPQVEIPQRSADDTAAFLAEAGVR